MAEARRTGAARLKRRKPAPLTGRGFLYLICIALLLGWYAPDWSSRLHGPPVAMDGAPAPYDRSDTLTADFGFCHSGGGTNCVVDGDTFWFRGAKYRIADIDTPETHGPRCAEEAERGAQATQRLQALLNAGPFALESADRDTDRYGRSLRIVTRRGESIGAMMVSEGLARSWDGARHPWCGLSGS